MEPSLPANSRVTVECTDPSGLFGTFEPILANHLPLRNLHWKSPHRPLRAINTLHVALQQSKYGQTEAPHTERRHQIPGLRQTSYLKIYLLRCDDKETYKAVCRKQIREWVKNNTSSSDNKAASGQESHDAFEWLIVHVVVPGTPAASEPRTAKITSSLGTTTAALVQTDSTESINSGSKSKWPGKGSSTVYEKIRADFNSSSKSAIDRVAQVRLGKTSQGQQLPGSVPYSSEPEDQWEELVEKLKVSILTSFDLRVRQYENDIRERDSQRSLPGWNFCTFFILKEGLALGFESVGLLEDALIGYKELAVGLDAMVLEQSTEGEDARNATFLGFSKDLKGRIRAAVEGSQTSDTMLEANLEHTFNESAFRLDEALFPLDQRKKPYRELILSNDISVFDFRIYIFARQVELLLRAANLPSSSLKLTAINDGRSTTQPRRDESFLFLAKICQQAVIFINLGARTLRQELYQAWGGSHDSEDSTHMQFQESVIDNIISTWIYCATTQVLEQTRCTELTLPEVAARAIYSPSMPLQQAKSVNGISESVPAVREDHEGPFRPSSQELFSPSSYSNGTLSQLPTGPYPAQSGNLAPKKTGTEELAACRAALYLLARQVIEATGKARDWLPDVNGLGNLYAGEDVHNSATLKEVSLHETSSPEDTSSGVVISQSTTSGLEPDLLKHASRSQEYFAQVYEWLTNQAYRHFLASEQSKSAKRALADIAMFKYHSDDYAAAIPYFEEVLTDSNTSAWNALDGLMLELYADCLKRLKRRVPYTRVLLRLLATYCVGRRSPLASSIAKRNVGDLVDDLCSSSDQIDDKITVPMIDYFEVMSTSLSINHFDGRDGFYVPLSIRTLLGTSINISGGIKLTLTSRDGAQSSLELDSLEPVVLEAIATTVSLKSNVTTSGWFEPGRLELIMGNIVFLYEYGASKARQRYTSIAARTKENSIIVFPCVGSFEAKAKSAPQIILPRPRSTLIELRSGWNKIRVCSIRLKAATAGLRLKVHEATLMDGTIAKEVSCQESKDGQTLSFSHFPAEHALTLSIPYSLESADTTSLAARMEASYDTEHGTYVSLSTISINTILPVHVNVQDVFTDSSLISRFTISPATLVPLRIESCDIAESEHYVVESGIGAVTPMDVFPKQPASVLYRLTKRSGVSPEGKATLLTFSVDFHCLDEVVLSAIEDQFLRDIASDACAGLARLLCAHLLNTLRAQWTEQDLEVAGLLQEIEIWSYVNIGWEAVILGLPKESRTEAERWLLRWHREHLVIPLQHTERTMRRVSLPVEVPTPGILLTVGLSLENDGDRNRPIGVGEPLAAELCIEHTTIWAKDDGHGKNKGMEFSYEVIASPEMWLLGGRRRGNFTIDTPEQRSFSVLLIPQRAGNLLLPPIEIKLNALEKTDHGAGTPKNLEPAFEVNLRSQGRRVLVIPNLQETTTALDADGIVGRALLVGSQHRLADE